MNKKSGCICSTVSEYNKNTSTRIQTVYEFLPCEFSGKLKQGNLHTIGRLDCDTEGLLLFTTNGDFSHKVSMPDFHVKKTYKIILKKSVGQTEQKNMIEKCAEGFFIPRKWNSPAFTCLPSQLILASESECTLSEGKFHQVKRMICELGNEVQFLKRLAIGNLTLDEKLQSGQWRYLTQDEIVSILRKN